MRVRGTEIALGVAAVGTAAAVGYLLRSGRVRRRRSGSSASIGAKVIAASDVPSGATVVDGTSRKLAEIPGVERAIESARQRGRDRWAHVTIEREDAWSVVDTLRESLPYHEDGHGYNGVFVKDGDSVLVIDAIGWDILEESPA